MLPILARHIYQGVADVTTAAANLAPIGTGPFKLGSYQKDAQVELVRNEDYFKPGLPKLDRLVFRIIREPATALLAYQQGEIDTLSAVDGKDIAALEAAGDSNILRSTSGPGGGNCIVTVSFNPDRAAAKAARASLQRQVGAGLCTRDTGTKERDSLQAVPDCRADLASDLISLAVDQHRGRQGKHPEIAHCGPCFVDEDARFRQAQLPVKSFDNSNAAGVGGQRDDLEPGPAQLLLQTIKCGKFLPAWWAPCRPDVQQDILPPKIRQRQALAAAIAELQFRHHLRGAQHAEIKRGFLRACRTSRHDESHGKADGPKPRSHCPAPSLATTIRIFTFSSGVAARSSPGPVQAM